ncbi:MAG: hypothetical protein WKG07_14570 [Hymenobacter sp.]
MIILLGTSLQLAAAPAPDSITWKRVALPASDPDVQANFANTPEATYVAGLRAD